MPMPSLFKYFAFVGAALLAIITLANFLLDPSTGATVVAATPKPALVVQHDPRASKVERWRNEQAALKAASQTQTATNASLVTKSELAPPPASQAGATAPIQAAVVQPAPAPVAQPAPVEPALQTADVSADHDAEAARAAEAAHAKAEKAKAAKAARKAKLARERAKAEQLAQSQQNPWQQGQTGFFGSSQQRSASAQQDQFYNAQRGQREASASNAYAPRPAFGPFGGWGRAW